MGLTGTKSSEINEHDNVYDIVDLTKDNLKALKNDLDFSKEVGFEADLDKLNRDIDRYFNGFLDTDWGTSITLDTGKTATVKSIVMTGNKSDMDALTRYVLKESRFLETLDQFETQEVRNIIQQFSFEAKKLKKEISSSENTTSTPAYNANPLKSGIPETETADSETADSETSKRTYKNPNHYVQPYENSSYAQVDSSQHIENIYQDTKVKKVLERIFDEEENEELRRGTFALNLSVEDGLGGIIIAIRDALQMGRSASPDEDSKAYQLYTTLLDSNMMNLDDGIIDLSFESKDIKKLIKTDKLLTYKHKNAGDLSRISKILTRAKREDLDTFASLLQSKPNITMAVKEWHNALEMTGNSRDDKEGYSSSLITGENVLDFLCDFNSDGNLSAVYKKKNYKEQKQQGDVGNLFGQQVEFTIEQAIRVKSVELDSTAKGEQFVISNIVKNMPISDSRNLTQSQQKLLSKMQEDSNKCTKENLALLVNGDGDDMPAMPEMKIFFLDSIKKINGGSEATTPDLYDTLVGKDAEYIASLSVEQYDKERKLKKVLDDILVKSEDPGIKAEIEKNGLVRVRETLFIKIMTALDHVEITTADNPNTQLQSPGIDKGWTIQETKNDLLDKIIQALITTGIHYSTTGGLRLMLGYGKEGMSTSGRTKRSRGAGAGVILQSDAIEIAINISGDVAEQYNYKHVINADLSKVANARYVGIEGGALAGISLTDRGVAAEAYAGINRQQDPLVGINQLDKQYTSVSEEIFTLTELPDNILESKETFGKYLYKKINDHTTDSVYGKFVANNQKHLRANADFIVRYMDANNLFGPKGLLNDKSQKQQKDAITSLMTILQTGNQELRRHDVIAALHGKVALTKLSFGVTTNALTLKFSSTPPAPPATGVDGSQEGTPQNTSTDRFGLCGFYVGMRISTWKNTYVPNVAPYLFTQYEMETGRDTEHVEKFSSLDKYAAYLQALYHDDKRLSCRVNNDKLVITFTPDEEAPSKDKETPTQRMTLQKYLNLYATEEAKKYFSLDGNTLTIGNVGDIGAYTATEAQGVRRILCLGTKELGKAKRIRENTGTASTLDPISFKEVGTRERSKSALTKDIIPQLTGTGSTLETVKTETAAFLDAQGALIAPPKTKVTFTPSTIEGTTLTTGTLSILKHNDGSYTVSLDTTPDNQLTINYNAYTPGQSEQPTTLSSSTDKLFTFEGTLYEAQSELTKLSKSLIELENTNRTAYAAFLDAASTAEASDGTIDTAELAQAIIYLEKLLGTNKQFVNIRGFLKSDNRAVKSYVIDRFKQILAREYMYYSMKVGKILDGHIKGKNHWYDLLGPSQLPLSSALQKEMSAARQSLQEKYGNVAYTNTDTTHVAQNLIGYTAFYRPKEQTYSLTSLGDTSYIGELKPLTPALAQEWFLDNFKTNKYEVELLATTLEAELRKQGITLTLKKDIYTDTFSRIQSLLKGEPLPIDSGKEISIDLKWVFYLLGDCCNESLGMEITKIHITSKSAPTASYTATATPEKKREGGIDIWNKSHSVSSHVRTTEKKVSLKYHHALQEETPPPPKPTDVDPELPPAPDPTIPDPEVPGSTIPE